MDAKDFLRAGETLLTAASSARALPPPWGIVLAAAGSALGLAADIAAAGHDVVIAIEEMRSIVPGWIASRQRLRDYIDSLAKGA